jgi:hypothetical protein
MAVVDGFYLTKTTQSIVGLRCVSVGVLEGRCIVPQSEQGFVIPCNLNIERELTGELTVSKQCHIELRFL